MDVPNRRRVLPVLLNHRSPGVSPGTWESRAMSPTGYPGYPTPLPAHIERRPATAVARPHWTVHDKPIARASEEFPEAREILETSLESELSCGVRRERSGLPSDEGAQGVGIRRDRDVGYGDTAVEERRHV